MYDLTYKEIHIILGFGINVWKNYEKNIEAFNTMSTSNKLLISLICDPNCYIKLLEENESSILRHITDHRYKEIKSRAQEIKKSLEGLVLDYRQIIINDINTMYKPLCINL
jgi:biotin-(acetyl-CoA carboxylase) ligase